MDADSKKTGARLGRWIFGAVILGSLAAGAGYWFWGQKVWTDGVAIKVADSETRVREVIWTAPEALPAEINTDAQEYEPSISPDASVLYFVRGKPGSGAHIYSSHRQDGAWTKAEPVAGVNGPTDDLGPRLTADGRFLLFYSDRPGGFGGYDIWAAPRAKDGSWGTPFNLGPTINSEFNEFSPDPTPDGTHLIFATNRTAALREQKENWKATIRENHSGDYDLWIARIDPGSLGSVLSNREDASGGPAAGAAPTTVPTTVPTTQPDSALPLQFSQAHEIEGVNTTYTEGASCMSPAGDFLYFSSDRPGGFGRFDIYRARVENWKFGSVENLGPSVNTADNEADPALGLGGYRLYFSSDRPSSTGGYDIFVSESREVFAQRTGHPMPHLGASVWVMLVSLLILLPLLLGLRGWGEHRLSLLQKCLLISLLIHVLITFALSFVMVSQQMRQYVKKETGVDLALSLPKELKEVLAIRNPVSSDLPVRSGAPSELSPQNVPAPAQAEALAAPKPIDVATPRAQLPDQVKVEIAPPTIAPPAPAPAKVAMSPQTPESEKIDVHVALPRESKPLSAVEQQAVVTPPAVVDQVKVPVPDVLQAPLQLKEIANAPTAKPPITPEVTPPDLTHIALPAEATAVTAQPARDVAKPQADIRINPHAPVAQAQNAPVVNEPVASAPKLSAPDVASAAATTALPAPRAQVHEQSAVAAPAVSSLAIHPAVSAPSQPAPQMATTDAPQATVAPAGAPKQQIAEASPVARAASAELQQATAGPSEPIEKSALAGAGPASVATAAVPQSKPDQKSLAGGGAPAVSHASGHPSLTGGIDTPPDVVRDASLVSAPQIALAGASSKQQSEERSPTATVAAAAPTSASPLSQTGNLGATGPVKVAIDAAPARSDAQPTTQPAFAAARASDRVAGLLAGPASAEAAPAPNSDAVAAAPDVALLAPHASAAPAADRPLVADGSPAADPTTRPIAADAVATLTGDKTGKIGIPDSTAGVAPANHDATAGSTAVEAGPRHVIGAPATGVEVVAASLPDSSPDAVDPILPHAGAKRTETIAGAPAAENNAPAAGTPLAPSRFSGVPSVAAMPTSIGLPAAAAPSPGSSIASATVMPRSSITSNAPSGAAQANTSPVPAIQGIEGPQLASPNVAGPAKPTRVSSAPGTPAETVANADAIAGTPKRVQGPIKAHGPSDVVVDFKAASPDGAKRGKGKAGDDFGPVASGPAGKATGRPLLMSNEEAAPEVAIAPLPGSQGPGRLTAPDSPYSQRAVEQRKPLIEKLGGTNESEAAVARALAYLARFQEPDGRWTYVADDALPGRRPKAPHDMAYTALSLLAFLAQDNAPNKPGPYRDVVGRGVAFLISNQDTNGDLRGPADMRGAGSGRGNLYDQGIATLALAEAALITHDPHISDAAFAGARFIIACQNNETGGWRYTPQEPGDTSVFGWELMALHSTEMLGFEIPDLCRKRMLKYVEYATSGRHGMLASYLPAGSPTASMTAEMAFCRMILGQKLGETEIKEATDFLAQEPPDLSKPDLYYWYYASLSMVQMQNRSWKVWNAYTRDGLVRMQQKGGPSDGAWKVSMKRAERAGNIFTTAIGALTLEVYYRYAPLLEAPPAR